MTYIRNNCKNVQVEGINISDSQLKDARQNGFKVYKINYTELKNHLELSGQYDAVITNGSLEYLRRYYESHECYRIFCQTVYKLLKPHGKWYTSTIHYHKTTTLYDKFMLYCLAFGNEGGYPSTEKPLSSFASKENFKILLDEDHTSDYLEYSSLFGDCYRYEMKNVSQKEKVKMVLKHLVLFIVLPNYLEMFLCYHPPLMKNNLYWCNAWIWQFIPQHQHQEYEYYSPMKLNWILCEK